MKSVKERIEANLTQEDIQLSNYIEMMLDTAQQNNQTEIILHMTKEFSENLIKYLNLLGYKVLPQFNYSKLNSTAGNPNNIFSGYRISW